jgi:hypothetical protein
LRLPQRDICRGHIVNGRTARDVVWELFQDLESFRLDEYKAFDDDGKGMNRLVRYFETSVVNAGGKVSRTDDTRFNVICDGGPEFRITTDRDSAKEDDNPSLRGLEHPLVRSQLTRDKDLDSNSRALIVHRSADPNLEGALSFWHIHIHGGTGKYHQRFATIGLDKSGNRLKSLEQASDLLGACAPAIKPLLSLEDRRQPHSGHYPRDPPS